MEDHIDPVWVCIHGFCETSIVWHKLVEECSIWASSRFLLIDLPGHNGQSIQGERNLEDVAETVIQQLDSEIGDHPILLVGHSMGYYIALEVAIKSRQTISGLICLHSHPYGDTPEKREGRDKAIQFIDDYGSAAFIRKTFPRLFAEPFASRNRAEIVQLCDRFIEQIPTSVIVRYLEFMRDRNNRTEFLRTIDYPVGYLIGQLETTLPYSELIRQTELTATSCVEVFPTANHMSLISQPEETARFFNEFRLFIHDLALLPSEQ